MDQVKEYWRINNEPVGKMFGYPSCCIHEFCMQPPELLEVMTPQLEDKIRFTASCIDGEFSGFIPCVKHAKKILMGKITLSSLIKNRDQNLPKFPVL